ncbi:unnamed protein product [Cladocopium goreaui]|uniref:Apple domain-containing protein n=1 Tax=Cladocopium goreaui TaxID=2562237 RepID=A0A9P1FSV9_9DINO|nr:unnamed protein product [Cladocopium goreaui]
MVNSDLEELLEDFPAERLERPRRFAILKALAVGVVVLAALGFLTVKVGGLQKASREFLALEETEEKPCFQVGMYYADPVKLDASERTVEFSAELCQQRCQVVPECSHFTFWPDGGCLLTGEASAIKAAPFKFSGTKVGPKFCQEAIDAANAAIDAAAAQVDGEEAGLPTLAPAKEATEADIHEAAVAITQMLPGVNGTSCSAYPACVTAGIKEGECCPNAEKVSLGCCDGFPKVVPQVQILLGSECEKFPACAKLNMTGGCCPTPDGVKLGCCLEI